MSASHAQWVARRGIVRPPTIPPGGAGIGPFWRVCDVQVDGGRGGWDVAEWAVSIGVELGQFTVDVHGDGAEEVDVVVVGGPQVGQHLVLDQLATGAHFGDGAAVVLADPGDDRVGGDGQAPCLLGLLLGVAVSCSAVGRAVALPSISSST